ncbi:hypothetical protein N9980_00565 [bacterium]|nr:hypothetical protein [bacterium]
MVRPFSPSGLTAEQIAEVARLPYRHFAIRSVQTYILSQDPDAATIFTGLEVDHPPVGWQVESALGGMRNVSGAEIEASEGLVSFHVRSSNPSSRVLSFYSETSIDNGVTWSKNTLSARTQTIASTVDQFQSKSSEAFDIPDQAIVRFRAFVSGSGVTVEPVSLVANGDTVTGPSFRWRLTED